MILDMTSTEDGDGIVTIIRSGTISKKVRVTYPKWPYRPDITFDSTYEYNYWLYLQHFKRKLGIAEVFRNTTKLPYLTPMQYEVRGKKYVRGAYRPDFLVLFDNGTYKFVETKGWENERHKATVEAVKRNFPHLNINLVGRQKMLELQNEYSSEIDGWIKIK